MNTANLIPLNARSLSYAYCGRRYTLEYDAEYLTCTSTNWPESDMSKTPLWRLLPDLLVDRSVPHYLRSFGRETRYLLAGAVVVYFSDIRSHAPLLAPMLVIIGLWCLLPIFRAGLALKKTKIVTEYGEEIAVVPHHVNIEAQRAVFEQGLLEAIRASREEDDVDP